MQLKISVNIPEVSANIRNLAKQVQYAGAVALTKTAKEVQTGIQREMMTSFDHPTDYTLGSVYMTPATKQKLVAKVGLKDDAFKGVPAARYLAPQIYGGKRSMKAMEKALQAAGLMPSGHFAVPAVGAQMDQFGNVKTSQIVQIMSQLRVQRGGGYDSKRSNSKASKRSVEKQGVTYFAVPKTRNRLKPGIYAKVQFSTGSAVRPVFIFVSTVKYKEALEFFKVAQEIVAEKFQLNFKTELKKAIATAR